MPKKVIKTLRDAGAEVALVIFGGVGYMYLIPIEATE